MVSLIPDTQMGPFGSLVLWMGIALIVIVALFTTGAGPVLIALLPIVLIAAVLFIAGRRVWFRLTRGK